MADAEQQSSLDKGNRHMCEEGSLQVVGRQRFCVVCTGWEGRGRNGSLCSWACRRLAWLEGGIHIGQQNTKPAKVESQDDPEPPSGGS